MIQHSEEEKKSEILNSKRRTYSAPKTRNLSNPIYPSQNSDDFFFLKDSQFILDEKRIQISKRRENLDLGILSIENSNLLNIGSQCSVDFMYDYETGILLFIVPCVTHSDTPTNTQFHSTGLY